MPYVFLFIFGLVVGSFMNVIALRYDGERFVADPAVIGGRSHCPHCGTTLRWYELVPVVSFVVQGRRCRHCQAAIGWQYPAVELVSALIVTFVPAFLFSIADTTAPVIVLSVIWVVIFEILLLVAYIDLRLGIIPDELNLALGVLGVFLLIEIGGFFGLANHSFFGSFAPAFGYQGSLWLNHLAAALGATAFFALLVGITRGRGMGLGDVKLAAPLGLIFGWPDIGMLVVVAFVSGALVGVGLIAARRRTMKGSIPFGPFLVGAAAVTFFAGFPIVRAYFDLVAR
ncbi:MAG TPA: prepilin peptidase [Candidatus Paceibacterota bacterium]|nr:prepilin peptidase [Candidatus Paceibacterota bacterium]